MIDKTSLDNTRSIDLITFLEQHKGFHFRHSNGEYRCTEHTSLAVKSDRLSWYWHSKGIGGYGAIDFLMKIEGYDFKRAITVLADEPTTAPPPPQTADIQKAFFLPEKAKSNRRAYAYLTLTRGLDSHIINELIQEKKIYEDTKGNAVFVGYDEQGKPKYATLRGTYTDNPLQKPSLAHISLLHDFGPNWPEVERRPQCPADTNWTARATPAGCGTASCPRTSPRLIPCCLWQKQTAN